MFGFKKNKTYQPMTPEEAERIVNLYGKAIAKGGLARYKSLLPCSKARIMYAYYVYLEALISQGILTQELGENLVSTYALLPAFIDDVEAKEINNIMEMRKNGLNLNDPQNRYYVDKMGDLTRFMPNMDYMNEINDFIEECYKQLKGI